LLVDRLTHTMSAAKRSGCYGALLFLDLDNFKPLNDAHGHEIGDLLLIEVARRLTSCVREMDTVARVGGDEFVIMLSELSTQLDTSQTQALAIAEKVRDRLATPYFLASEHPDVADSMVEHRCTVSIGGALFVNDNVSHKEILRLADDAMYDAKRAGRNSIRFHELDAQP
jgi:diguanylate cyclase (GGDEF)-like protein